MSHYSLQFLCSISLFSIPSLAHSPDVAPVRVSLATNRFENFNVANPSHIIHRAADALMLLPKGKPVLGSTTADSIDAAVRSRRRRFHGTLGAPARFGRQVIILSDSEFSWRARTSEKPRASEGFRYELLLPVSPNAENHRLNASPPSLFRAPRPTSPESKSATK